MYSVDELEIIKSSLEGDLIRQKKQLENEDFGSDIRFEMWYVDTQKLHKKVSKNLSDLKIK